MSHFIHCIEYLLGTVSNTASYLRLWALSLAHSQLTLVFYEMIYQPAILTEENLYQKVAKLILLFPLFLAVNVAVLNLMDCLECFLHALRLHWVEFQGKFVEGGGKIFVPLSRRLIDEIIS